MTTTTTLCDFDECRERPTTRRGELRLCARHAAEFDALDHGPAPAPKLQLVRADDEAG